MRSGSGQMTATEMLPAIGTTVMVRFEDLMVACLVKDVKSSWGKARLLVLPIAGEGTQWVEMGRVSGKTSYRPVADRFELAEVR